MANEYEERRARLQEQIPGLLPFRVTEGLGVTQAIMLNNARKFFEENADSLNESFPNIEPPNSLITTAIVYEHFERCFKIGSKKNLEELCSIANGYIGSQFDHMDSFTKAGYGKTILKESKEFSRRVVGMTMSVMLYSDEQEYAWTKAIAHLLRREVEEDLVVSTEYYTIHSLKSKYLVYTEDNSQFHLLTLEQAKMVRTKIREASTLVCLATSYDSQSMQIGFRDRYRALIKEMYRWTLKAEEGRDTEVFALMEALLNGELLRESDKDHFDNDGFLGYMWDKLREVVSGQPENYRVSKFHQICLDMTTPELVESMSIAKALGFAIVDVEATFTKVSGRLSTKVDTDPVTLADFQAFIRHNFCQNYFFKFKKWPKMMMHVGCHRAIVQANLRGVWISDPLIVRRFGRANYQHFGRTSFETTITWDPYIEALELSKDTSIVGRRKRMIEHSLALEGLEASYRLGQDAVERALKEVKETRLRIEEKSLLAAMLATRNLNDHLITTNEYYYSRNVSKIMDLASQGLVPKMGELKSPAGRLFGKMTMELRHKRSVDQHNAEKIHKIWQPLDVKNANDARIIQNMNRLTYYNRLFDKNDDRINFTIMIDAERWCNCHSQALYDRNVGIVFDEILGARSFRNIMKESGIETMCLTSDGVVKIFKRNPRAMKTYMDDKPGCSLEGQEQSIGSDGYGSVILYCLRDIEEVIEYNNGDNADALCSASRANKRPGETDLEFMYRTVEELQVKMARFGYRIKLTETMVSKNLSVMCKRVIDRGRLIGTGLKKGAKICNEPEDAFMVTENIVSSMSSNLASAVYQGMSHIGTYSVYVCRLVMYFRRLLGKVKKKEIGRILLRPGILGGYAISSFIDILIRGCSDPLSRALSLLRFQSTSNDNFISSSANYILTHTPLERHGVPHILAVRNPNGLSISRPRSASQVITAAMLKVIADCPNKHIKKLARVKIREIEKGEVDYLTRLALSLRPFSPRVASAIASCGDSNLASEVILKFTKSRTLSNVYLIAGRTMKSLNRLLNRVTEADLRFIDYLVSTPEGDIRSRADTACRHAQELREACFGPQTFDSYPAEVEAYIWTDEKGEAADYPYSPEFIVAPKPQIDERERPGHNEPLDRNVDLEKKTVGKLDVQIPEFCQGNKKYDRIKRLLLLIGHLGNNNQRLRAHLIDYIRQQDYEIAAQIGPIIPLKYSGTLRHRLALMVDELLSGLNCIAGLSTNMKKQLKKAIALATLGDTSTNMILLECYATTFISFQLMFPVQKLPNRAVFRFTLSRHPDNMHDVSDPVFTFLVEPPEKSAVFSYEHPLERKFVQDSIAESLADKRFRALSSFTSPRVVNAARTVLAMAYVRPKKDLAEEIGRYKGYRKLTGEDFDLIEQTYGIKSTGLTFSLNDLRSLPSMAILREVVSGTISWAIFNQRFNLRDLDLALVSMVQIYELPFRNLARELIDSLMMPVLALAVTALGLPKPSTGECYRVEACQRWLLKTATLIISYFLRGAPLKALIPKEHDALPFAPDDLTIREKMFERINVRAMRIGQIHMKDYHSMVERNCGRFLRAVRGLHVIQNFPAIQEVMNVALVQRSNATPTKLKDLDTPLKVLISSTLRFNWWERAWGKMVSNRSGKVDKKLQDQIIDAFRTEVVILRTQDAITVARANQSLEFETLLKTLTGFTSVPIAVGSPGLQTTRIPSNRVLGPRELEVEHRPIAQMPVMADIHDKYLVKASNCNRVLGSEVTSCNKFLDILEQFKLRAPKSNTNPIATFAEGSGGTALMLLELFSGSLVFNTLVDEGSPLLPSCIMNAGSLYINRVTLLESATLPSDMSQEDTARLYSEMANSNGLDNFILVTCDAESLLESEMIRQSERLFCNVSLFCASSGHDDVTVIFKVSGRDEELIEILCKSLVYFDASTLYRSKATHTDSAELFVVAQGVRRSEVLSSCHNGFPKVSKFVPPDVYGKAVGMINYVNNHRPPLTQIPAQISLPHPRVYSQLIDTCGFSFEKFLRQTLSLEVDTIYCRRLIKDQRVGRALVDAAREKGRIRTTMAKTAKPKVISLVRYKLVDYLEAFLSGNMTKSDIVNLDTLAEARRVCTFIVGTGEVPPTYGVFMDGSIGNNFGDKVDVRLELVHFLNNILRIAGAIDLNRKPNFNAI